MPAMSGTRAQPGHAAAPAAPLHDGRGHVRGDAQPHKVVDDEAVEPCRRETTALVAGAPFFRQNTVCVETDPAGRTAAISVTRLRALATSR